FKVVPRSDWRPLFHDVQEEDLLLGRHLRDVVFVVATRIERLIESLRSISQRIAVRRIGRRHGRHRFCQIVQDVRKQPIVEMHANGFAYVGGASAVQAERNSGFIEMGVEAGRSLERSNIELDSSATSALSGMGLVMARITSYATAD